MTSLKKHIIFIIALLAVLVSSTEFSSQLQSIVIEEASIENEIEEETSDTELTSISTTSIKHKKSSGGNALNTSLTDEIQFVLCTAIDLEKNSFNDVVLTFKEPFYILYCCLLINRA